MTHLRYQNLVTILHAHRQTVALLVKQTGSNSQNLRLIELFDRAFWKKNAARGLCLGFYTLHEHAIEERCDGSDGLENGRLGGRISSSMSAHDSINSPFWLGAEWAMRKLMWWDGDLVLSCVSSNCFERKESKHRTAWKLFKVGRFTWLELQRISLADS